MKVDPNKHYGNFSSIPHKAGTNILKEIQSLEGQGGTTVLGGAGEMGSRISITFPRVHSKTIMQDIDIDKLKESKKNALSTMAKGVSKRKVPQSAWVETNVHNLFRHLVSFPNKNAIPFGEIDKVYINSRADAKESVQVFLDNVLGKDSDVRKDYGNVMMVLEAVPERLDLKQNYFRFFELALSSPNAILASNTSSLSIDEMAAKVENPERVVGFHYFLPADRNPLLEIIAGSQTSLEVVQAMYDLAISMGKKPIICWKDSPLAIANRILAGTLNEAAHLLDEGLGTQEEIDRVFLEIFYSEQISLQTQEAKPQFEAAPKLGMFKDERRLYKEIQACDEEQKKALKKGDYTLRKELLAKKKSLVETTFGRLRQKFIYLGVLENATRLGSFFTPAQSVSKLKELAKGQLKIIGDYLANVEKVPDYITKSIEPALKPYEFPKPEKLNSPKNYRNVIKDRLMGAYIALGQQIFKEGLASAQDIEIACKEGFKYNHGPLELARKLGKEKVEELTTLVNKRLDTTKPTGISKPSEYIELVNNELSGVQSYMQDGVGFILLGGMHIQAFRMTDNSLSLEMLDGIRAGMEALKEKGAKAILLRSQGGGAFSAGAHLTYVRSIINNDEKLLAYRNKGKNLMNYIANFEIPTIAVVDGPAVGGGLELALACNQRVFTDQAVIFFPEVGIGLIPDWGGIERLTAITGKDFAKRYICSAKLKNMGIKLGSEDCYRIGIADAFVTQANLPHLVTDLIEGKGSLDIYTKAPTKANYDKKAQDFPAHIVSRVGLNRPFKHNLRWVTRHPAHYAEHLIDHADDLEYINRVNNDEAFLKLAQSAKKVQKRYVNPQLYIAQSKILAPLVEMLKGFLGKLVGKKAK